MQIQVTSDNMDISDSMQALAQSKVEKLSKHFEGVPEDLQRVRVVLNSGAQEDTFDSSVELSLGGMVFVGKATEFSLETSIIQAVNDVERQYLKEKSKRDSKDWEEAREMKRFPVDEE